MLSVELLYTTLERPRYPLTAMPFMHKAMVSKPKPADLCRCVAGWYEPWHCNRKGRGRWSSLFPYVSRTSSIPTSLQLLLERDSPRDQLVVTLFLLTVFGLLLGAGVKSRMLKAGFQAEMPWNTGRRWWEVSIQVSIYFTSCSYPILFRHGCLGKPPTKLVFQDLDIVQIGTWGWEIIFLSPNPLV